MADRKGYDKGEFASVTDLNSPYYNWFVEILGVWELTPAQTQHKRAEIYYKVKPCFPATWSHDAFLTFNANQLD